MTLARVRRPTCEARSAAWKASPSTYTPPWKYRTTWRGSIPSMVISAVGTPPSAAAVTVTPAGSGCADVNSRSSRRCSLTSLPNGEGVLSQGRVEVLSLLGAHGGSPFGWGWLGSAPGRARPCQSAAENFLPGGGHLRPRGSAPGPPSALGHSGQGLTGLLTPSPLSRRSDCMIWNVVV